VLNAQKGIGLLVVALIGIIIVVIIIRRAQ
jgi:hypothetical protein